ncbi:hypothetical protein COW86_05190, partial [Candidatus Kuenenbacteria bacterium CG22_combo_CG10-13_8_21_14_all_39_9]
AGNITAKSSKQFTINCTTTCSGLTVTDPTTPNTLQTIGVSGTNVSFFIWKNTGGTFTSGVYDGTYDGYKTTGGSINWLSPSSGTPQVSVTPYNSASQAGSSCTASIRVADFSISLSPTSQTVTKPTEASFAITKTYINGWELLTGNAITYSVKSCPSATAGDCYFSGDNLKIKTANLSAGTYTAQITGTNSTHNLSRDSNTVSLEVAVSNNWGITVLPSSNSVTAGGSTTYTAQIRDTAGNWTSSVNPITCSIPGAGTKITCSVSPTSVAQPSSTADVVVTVNTASDAPAGNYVLTVT